jgi:hypothetical protein
LTSSPPEPWQLETLLLLINEMDAETTRWLLGPTFTTTTTTIEWWMQTYGRVSALLNHLDPGDEEEI